MDRRLLFPICAILMLGLTAIRGKKYKVSLLKWIPLTLSIAVMGSLGTYIMYWIENGEWYGQSFFGAVLFFPILLLPVALLFRMPMLDLLDYATPPGLALLAPFKINCYIGGCCDGRVLFYNENGIAIHFPIQLVESLVAVILTSVLLFLEKRSKYKHKIYPLCLVMYGGVRFVLNWLRWDQEKNVIGLTAGSTWSLVSCCIGIVWLMITHKRNFGYMQENDI